MGLVLIGWVGPKVNGFDPNRLGWTRINRFEPNGLKKMSFFFINEADTIKFLIIIMLTIMVHNINIDR